MAEAKVDLDPNFEDQCRRLRDTSDGVQEAYLAGTYDPAWYRPDYDYRDWDQNPDDPEDVGIPFQTVDLDAQAELSVGDARDAGTLGDLMVACHQSDYISNLEQAYRLRHAMSPLRRLALAAGRHRGLGMDEGAFMLNTVEYTRRLLKTARGE
jgi:hypothetical protein